MGNNPKMASKTKAAFFGTVGGGTGIYGYHEEIMVIYKAVYSWGIESGSERLIQALTTISADFTILIGSALLGMLISWLTPEKNYVPGK